MTTVQVSGYKGVPILAPQPLEGGGGRLIQSGIKEFADRVGPVNSDSSDPGSTDDENNTSGNGAFYKWSKWHNSATNRIFTCTDPTPGSANWSELTGINSHMVTSFGAKGDGSNDDSSAIQAAIDAAKDSASNFVLFPPGDYLCNSEIELKQGVKIQGYGSPRIIAGTSGTLIRIPGSFNDIRGVDLRAGSQDTGFPGGVTLLRFDGDGGNSTYTFEYTIENVGMKDAEHAIFIGYEGDTTHDLQLGQFALLNCKAIIGHKHVIWTHHDGNNIPLGGFNSALIQDCHIYNNNNGSETISVNGRNTRIVSNILEGNRNCLRLYGGGWANCTIKDNWFENCMGDFLMHIQSYGYVTIDGPQSPSGTDEGVIVEGCKNVTVRGFDATFEYCSIVDHDRTLGRDAAATSPSTSRFHTAVYKTTPDVLNEPREIAGKDTNIFAGPREDGSDSVVQTPFGLLPGATGADVSINSYDIDSFQFADNHWAVACFMVRLLTESIREKTVRDLSAYWRLYASAALTPSAFKADNRDFNRFFREANPGEWYVVTLAGYADDAANWWYGRLSIFSSFDETNGNTMEWEVTAPTYYAVKDKKDIVPYMDVDLLRNQANSSDDQTMFTPILRYGGNNGTITISDGFKQGTGEIFTIHDEGGNGGTITPESGNIDGSSSINLDANSTVQFITDGTNFYTIQSESNDFQSITSNTTLDNNDYFVSADASSGSVTVTLPSASGIKGRVYHIKKVDSSSNNVTVDGNSAETIDGSETRIITNQYDSISIISDGSNWLIF